MLKSISLFGCLSMFSKKLTVSVISKRGLRNPPDCLRHRFLLLYVPCFKKPLTDEPFDHDDYVISTFQKERF